MSKVSVLISKLGTTKGAERSRIWIEGQRLAAADFSVGCKFIKEWSEGKLVLHRVEAMHGPLSPKDIGTVSGKGDKPIIDIVGAKVRAAFPDATHVKVRYVGNRIIITAVPTELELDDLAEVALKLRRTGNV